MREPYAVLALSLPEAYFLDGDASCRLAGTYIALELGTHLEKHGHKIPPWVRGGCQEDAWVYLESECMGVRYSYTIVSFPRGDNLRSMAVQYDVAVGWLKRLFGATPTISADDPIHALLREFGARYENSELLTRSEFRSQY
jgi:hypothetical protein